MELNKFEENGTIYFQLYISCPVDYDGRHWPRESFWHHGDDNCLGDIYVGDNATLKCAKCGKTCHVSQAAFDCPMHSRVDEELVRFTNQRSCFYMGLIGQIPLLGGVAWLKKFLENLGEW